MSELNSHASEPLDSRQLKAFALLAKTGSFTETARRLSVTHSAISHAMRALESNAGCRLLSRMGKKIILTDAGEALLGHAEEVLEEMRLARATLKGLNNWGCGRLRIAAESALRDYFLTNALLKFMDEFPSALMTIELSDCRDPSRLLESKRVDLVLSVQPPQEEALTFEPLFSDDFCIVVNPDHPWAQCGRMSREEIRRQPFIQCHTLSCTQRLLDEHLSRDEIVLNKMAEIDNVEAVKDFVKHRACMTILPAWSFRAELKAGTLVGFPLGRRAFQQTWGFTHWRGRPLSHTESRFIKLCVGTYSPPA